MTIPLDAIGLSERLREAKRRWAPIMASHPAFADATLLTTLDEAATALEALSARVKELEAMLALVRDDAMRLDHELCSTQAREEMLQQERDEAYERLRPFAFYFDLNDCDDRKDDDALEIHIKDLRAARDLIRRLAAGPDKEKRE